MATYSADELHAIVGLTPRTQRLWQKRGLIPYPQHVGRRTRHEETTVTRVRAIRVLRKRGESFSAIRRKLAKLSDAEIAAIAAPPAAPTPPPDNATYVALIPGLDLRIQANATPFARRIAQEIAERYSAH